MKYAYVFTKSEKVEQMVLNGKPSGKDYFAIFNPFFTSQGEIAYLARKGRNSKWSLVVAGKESVPSVAGEVPNVDVRSDGKMIGHGELRDHSLWWIAESL